MRPMHVLGSRLEFQSAHRDSLVWWGRHSSGSELRVSFIRGWMKCFFVVELTRKDPYSFTIAGSGESVAGAVLDLKSSAELANLAALSVLRPRKDRVALPLDPVDLGAEWEVRLR